jgi:hypothetical protein
MNLETHGECTKPAILLAVLYWAQHFGLVPSGKYRGLSLLKKTLLRMICGCNREQNVWRTEMILQWGRS